MIIQMPEEVLFKLVDYAKGLGRKEERIDSFKEPKFITQNQAHISYGKGNVAKSALREKSYNSIVTELDLLGYLEMKSERGIQRRTITFDPTSRNDGKNTCNLPSVMEVPTIVDKSGNPTAKNDFITTKIINSYLSMLAAKKEAQEKYDKVIEEIKESIEFITDANSANEFASHINEFEHVGSSLMKARSLFAAKVNSLGLVFDKETKTYSDAA